MPTVPAETPPLEPAKHKSEPCTNTPENRGLQEILTHFTAFKALIKLRSISSGFLYFYVCAFPSDRTACILHFNSLFSPSSLFTALLEFCRVFFARCSPSTGKQMCCYPSLLADPQVWLTYQLQRIFHIMGSLLKSQQTIAACHRFEARAQTELCQQSCSGSRSSRTPTGEDVYPGIILFCFNLASWIYCNEV